MIARAERLSLRLRRRKALKRMLVLSLVLHLLLLLSFLRFPAAPPMHEASAPASVEIMADEGTAEGVPLPKPSYAPAIVAPNEAPATTPPPPPAAPAFAVPTDELPTPPLPPGPPPTEAAAAPAAPAAPAASAAPPPPPAPQAQAPAPAPAPPPTPSAPAQVAELPPPPPPPPAPPSQSPPTTARAPPAPPTPQSRAAARPAPRPAPLPFTMGGATFAVPPPRNAPPQQRMANNHGALDLSLGPEALNSAGAAPHTTRGMDASIRVEGAEVGDDWIQQLHEWWDQHAFYPQEALMNGEDGVVQIHMSIQRDGRIDSVEIISSSGSRWIDMAGVSVWRNAHLRPFPTGTPEPRADVFVSLHYILVRRRG